MEKPWDGEGQGVETAGVRDVVNAVEVAAIVVVWVDFGVQLRIMLRVIKSARRAVNLFIFHILVN